MPDTQGVCAGKLILTLTDGAGLRGCDKADRAKSRTNQLTIVPLTSSCCEWHRNCMTHSSSVAVICPASVLQRESHNVYALTVTGCYIQWGASGDPIPHHYHVLLGFPEATMYRGEGERGDARGDREGRAGKGGWCTLTLIPSLASPPWPVAYPHEGEGKRGGEKRGGSRPYQCSETAKLRSRQWQFQCLHNKQSASE